MLDTIGDNYQAIIAARTSGTRFRNMRVTMAAGYVDGPVSQWPAGAFDAAHRAGLQVVRITVTGQPAADVADIEPGDLAAAGGASWAQGKHSRGQFGVLYVNRSSKAAVIEACRKLDLSRGSDYGLWVATLDGTFTDSDGSDLRRQRGVVGVQYLGARRAGIPCDVSLISDPDWIPRPAAPAWTHAAADKTALAIRALADVAAALEAHPKG